MKKVPKTRFTNYQDIWSETNLSTISPLRGGFAFKSKEFQNFGIPIIRISNILSNGKVGGEFAYYYKLPKDSKFILKGRSILLAMSGATTGKIAVLDSEEEYYQNQRVGYFKKTGKVDYDFLTALLQTKQFANQLNLVLVAGAQPNISSKEIDAFRFVVPENFEEQSAIGSLFRTLDDLLAAYKENLANYKAFKTSMLSKMFPKVGQKVPEIRLAGFEGEWKETQMKNHVILLNGRAYKQEELLDDGKYRVLRVGNFNTNIEWYYSDLELESNKYANSGDLLYLWATNFGPKIWDEEKIIYHYHIWKVEFNAEIIDRDYLYIWLENDKKKIQQNTNGSTMVHITKSIMEERKLLLPSYKEQKAIGSFFSNLDTLINSYQDKISQLETLKKKLLQDMFI
ncbi:restriction endonuclease subunit S [Streptococcus intermedius]|uniref:restriction endonuclease subunit S n=1 Tax=Streptococcus intermedius TaxID=1338 RepID=UPI001F6168BB|nr:restriction endonuclease subunit S [Streptococcus intermedius]MCI3916916.1 restriction endonuclease subunit S [Streptococcus intermedius]